ncbi:hypothetical protein DW817_01415 [Acidaminococcus sp. AM33-14BH]|nr:hypothetical protein DW817_01415 [Acidaminococcus sp. AM33-14BH]
MAYKNEIVMEKDVADIQTGLEELSKKSKVEVELSSCDFTKIHKINVATLTLAIHHLEESFSNNCCQANCCQTCQTCQGCQKCQTCQGCQTCQKCQGCQTCQKCQYYMMVNCNCDCSDDN